MDGRRPPSVRTVGLVVLASVILTAFHFTDNYVSFETYPQPGWISKSVVALSWPLFTAIGVAGYLLYRRGRPELAHPWLVAYSSTGLISLGHFFAGSPGDLTTRAVLSVLADAVAGSAVLAVALWSITAHRHLAARSSVTQPSARHEN